MGGVSTRPLPPYLFSRRPVLRCRINFRRLAPLLTRISSVWMIPSVLRWIMILWRTMNYINYAVGVARPSTMDTLGRSRARDTQDDVFDVAGKRNRVKELHLAFVMAEEVAKKRAQW